MRRVLKAAGFLVGGVIVVVLAALAYFNVTYPRVEKAPDITIVITPARVERGKYLVNDVVGCFYCRSKRDWRK